MNTREISSEFFESREKEGELASSSSALCDDSLHEGERRQHSSLEPGKCTEQTWHLNLLNHLQSAEKGQGT